MRQDELNLERACREVARRNGWAALKLEKNGNKGVPDDLFLHPDGRFFLVEFKKDGKQKPRPEQALWLSHFSKNSALIFDFLQFCALLQIQPPIEMLRP